MSQNTAAMQRGAGGKTTGATDMTTQQPDALRLAEMLTADEWPGHVTLVSYAQECVTELRRQQARITELESQLAQRFDAADMATASAQGFRDGVASLSANAVEPRNAIDRDALIDAIAQGLHGTWHCTRVWEAWHVGTMSQDDFEPVAESETPTEIADAVLALLAATPTAQAQGWQSIETAPKEGVFLVFMQDEVRPARRMQVANWHPNVKIVGGLFAFDCAKVTHWMPLPAAPGPADGESNG